METLVAGRGLVEPTLGRALMRYDLSGLLSLPSASPLPDPDAVAELAWTPDTLFLRFPERADREWVGRPRSEARVSGGLLGRLPDEILGLVVLVASSSRDSATRIGDDPLGGAPAERWIVRVPLDRSVSEGVPADAPDAQVLRDAYGLDDVEVEVWLIDGAVRRLRYAFVRDKAPYGGPDRTTVTYDWWAAPDADAIELPAPGSAPPG